MHIWCIIIIVPSMKVGNHSHSELVDFYSLGLHGRDEILKRKGWPVRTLGTLLNYFGEAHVGNSLFYYTQCYWCWWHLLAFLAKQWQWKCKGHHLLWCNKNQYIYLSKKNSYHSQVISWINQVKFFCINWGGWPPILSNGWQVGCECCAHNY